MTNATSKQVDFLRTLLSGKAHGWAADHVENAIDLMDEGHLSKTQASVWISSLVACDWKPRERAPRVEVEEGFYRAANGDIAKVQLNLAGTRKYAKRLTITNADGFNPHPDEDVSREDYEAWLRANATAEWVFETGLIGKIASEKWTALTLDEAQAFGRLYGVCCICGRRLTNEESIEKGIGPVCEGRFA